MKYRRLHPWTVTVPRARLIQEKLRQSLDLTPHAGTRRPRLVAGADVSYNRGSDVLYGAVVILTFPEMELVESAGAVARARIPYPLRRGGSAPQSPHAPEPSPCSLDISRG